MKENKKGGNKKRKSNKRRKEKKKKAERKRNGMKCRKAPRHGAAVRSLRSQTFVDEERSRVSAP